MYDRLHERLANPPRRLGALERDVMMQASCRAAADAGAEVAFQLRPGLVAEILRFYDQLRRQSQHVVRFQELIGMQLTGHGRRHRSAAAERLLRQTTFLADAFREYERRIAASGGCDEHALRERLVAEPAGDPIRHVVVTVADWIADDHGLYVADFDLLTRIPGLERLDVVCTEAVLGSGFHERLHTWLPGLDEENVARPGDKPFLVTPPDAPNDETWWTLRDREEELVAVARQLDADRRHGDAVPLDRTAVVYKTPLPYLYLAAEVFGAADTPYRTFDALPLAAEPTAASVDLVLETVSSDFTRPSLVALLRSPHFVFRHDGEEVTREAIAALDRELSQKRYLGDIARLEALAADGSQAESRPALLAILESVGELAPLANRHPASEQAGRLLAFWNTHLRPLPEGDRAAEAARHEIEAARREIEAARHEDALAARERRVRAAIAQTLSAIADVHAAHDDRDWTIDDLGIAVRRAIEDQTFEPEPADDARRARLSAERLHLLDDQAARYGDFDDVTIVASSCRDDWPERPRRNIFYPPALLKSLGWPSEKDRRGAADARFLDLLSSASRRTYVSTFTLDEDSLASRSMQLDEIPRARLSTISRAPIDDARVFADEALSIEPVTLDRVSGDALGWAELRLSRSPSAAPEFHGNVRGTTARAWSVSALETYLDCPFKFFAQHVLKLEEEPEDEEVMDPRRQGQFVHGVFEAFFTAWQDAGHRAITADNLDVARATFTGVVDRALERLPAAEAGLERTRLLGSPAAAGLGEAVFRMEAERPVAVVERLLEHPLRGDFTFATANGPRTIPLRGKADRIDLLADGTFRLIDYKLGWPPQRTRALQLPIYSLCAEQRLTSYRGRRWTLGEAAYLAFKGLRRVVPLFDDSNRVKVLAEAQQRLVDIVEAIERGEFPPTPDDVWRCETCAFASVCRKDYVGDV